MFNKMKAGLSQAGDAIAKGANQASSAVVYGVDKNRAVLDNFKTGGVLTLVSRTSGKALQLNKSFGKCTVDGKGAIDDSEHVQWHAEGPGVTNVAQAYIAQLHIGNCYLAVKDGATVIVEAESAEAAGEETKFRLTHTEQFVLLESVKEPNCHLGIMPDGELKSALATGKENNAHFGVKVIKEPPPPAKEPEKEVCTKGEPVVAVTCTVDDKPDDAKPAAKQ